MTTVTDPNNADRDTPNILASSATLQIGTSIFIAAPSSKVWTALTDTSTWPSWNSFVPRVTIRSQPDTPSDNEHNDTSTLSPVLQLGTRLTLHVCMDPTSSQPQAVTDAHHVITEYVPPDAAKGTTGHFCWASDFDVPGTMGPSLLKAERVHEIKDVEITEGENVLRGTEVRNWTCQVGWLVYVVKWMYGEQLRRNFELWVQDLKNYVEGLDSET
ncbi:hypothetical protein N7474_005731 [Penicillium riverlandense]|uniref:uncharacterized protein n=1 Tax=Penicillium riverlandense TaxID=1903569 RepID=UPI00254941EF|nr:uncharacterized protein N7474_005731 [Penicillium riverlandense]KAJ5820140.1 hypothetical protein N7474_005731 [Penicillium riverlandense]